VQALFVAGRVTPGVETVPHADGPEVCSPWPTPAPPFPHTVTLGVCEQSKSSQEPDRLVEGRIPRRRRLVRALLDASERGDGRAARLVLDRIWPPAKQEAKQTIELYFDAQDRDA